MKNDSVADFIAQALKSSNESIDRKALLSTYSAEVLTVEKGEMIDTLDGVVFESSRSNIVFGPIRTDYGFHIIEVLNRYRFGSQIDLDEAYDEIYQTIFNQKKKMRSVELIDSLRNHYNVKIYLESN